MRWPSRFRLPCWLLSSSVLHQNQMWCQGRSWNPHDMCYALDLCGLVNMPPPVMLRQVPDAANVQRLGARPQGGVGAGGCCIGAGLHLKRLKRNSRHRSARTETPAMVLSLCGRLKREALAAMETCGTIYAPERHQYYSVTTPT